MDKIIASLVNTYERLSDCCKPQKTIRWHKSVIDNAGKTTQEYRKNPTNPIRGQAESNEAIT